MKARSMATMDPDTEPARGPSRPSAARALRYVLALDEGPELLFFAGEPREPFSIGRTGTFHIDGNGVLDVHAFVHFDGQRLFMCSTDSVSPVLVDGAPLPRRWTELTPTCYLRFGAIALALRGPDTARPSRIGEESTVLDFAARVPAVDKAPASDHSLTRVVAEPTLVSARQDPPSYSRPTQTHPTNGTQSTQTSLARRDARRKVILAAVIFITVSTLAMTAVILGRIWSQRHRKTQTQTQTQSMVTPPSTAPAPPGATPPAMSTPKTGVVVPGTGAIATGTPSTGTPPTAPSSATTATPATGKPSATASSSASAAPSASASATATPPPATETGAPANPSPTSGPLPTGVIVHAAPPREVAPPTSTAAKTTTLERMAVDALHSGDLPKALELYERLAAEQPGNVSFENTVRILRQRTASPQPAAH